VRTAVRGASRSHPRRLVTRVRYSDVHCGIASFGAGFAHRARMNARFAYALGAALSIGACADLADGGDSDGAGGKADEINPTDSENLAKLKVTQPSMQGQPQPYTYSLTYRNAGIAIGQEYRLVKGPGQLQITNTLFDQGFAFVNHELVTGTNEVKLAAFTARWDRSANSPVAVDFGQKAQLSATMINGQPNTTRRLLNPQANAAVGALDGTESQPFVIFSGDYTIGFGAAILGEQTQTFAPGQFKRLDLTPPDKRATLRVHAPARSFPHPTAQCEPPNRNFLVQRNKPVPTMSQQAEPWSGSNPSYTNAYFGIVAQQSYPLAQDLTVRMLPFLATEAPMHYEYVVNNMAMPLDLQPGQTQDLYVKRIDVNHVLVTREDGTTYTQPGYYRVWRDVNGLWQPVKLMSGDSNCYNVTAGRDAFPTRTGIDVLPGKYKVVISYSTADGAKTQEHILTMN
jgi:hypothetical protein